ncbi:MAG: ribosomal-protein-alanine N-acetyltransferase, partial [Bdellovibrionales bacterium RIFOXYD1_FULL_44_7]
FKAELEKPYSRFLVLTDDETDKQILGYIVFWLLFDECQVLTLAVDPESRGRGYAKLLIRQAIKEAVKKDVRKITLEVRKSNLPAINLYQQFGFVVSRVLKSFYSNGEDAYLMTLDLEQNQTHF